MKWPFGKVSSTPPAAIDKHKALTLERARIFERLLNCKPCKVFPYHQLTEKSEAIDLIDVFVYEIEVDEKTAYVLITNGMSDKRLESKDQSEFDRLELIQYLRHYSEDYARRLYEMAWLPHYDGFVLHKGDTIAWPNPSIAGSVWKNSLFLEPLPKAHQNFRFKIENDTASLLWLVPISDEELNFKKREGLNVFLDWMQEKGLPWIFDETTRQSLI